MIDSDIAALDPTGCISIQPGPSPNWWLSPDVIMTTTADPSFAQQGAGNTTTVTVHWKAQCQLDSELPAVVFDLYLGDPSLVMTTANTFYATGSAENAGVSVGTSNTNPVSWTATKNAGDPNGPGHKCLIARAYPLGVTFTSTNLSVYLPDDPHYAQHNLTIAATDSPAPQMIKINTGNGTRERVPVLVHVMEDLHPNEAVLRTILQSLHTVKGFKQIATQPARRTTLNIDAFKHKDGGICEVVEHLVADVEGLFGIHKHPNVDAKFTIPPNFFASLNLVVDTSASKPGDAHIFHVTQTDEKGQFQGGLTVVAVRQ